MTYVDITDNTFVRINPDGAGNVTIQIYESELDDMAEVRMVEFTDGVHEIVGRLEQLIAALLTEETHDQVQDPDSDF